jgi:hypothetical protein
VRFSGRGLWRGRFSPGGGGSVPGGACGAQAGGLGAQGPAPVPARWSVGCGSFPVSLPRRSGTAVHCRPGCLRDARACLRGLRFAPPDGERAMCSPGGDSGAQSQPYGAHSFTSPPTAACIRFASRPAGRGCRLACSRRDFRAAGGVGRWTCSRGTSVRWSSGLLAGTSSGGPGGPARGDVRAAEAVGCSRGARGGGPSRSAHLVGGTRADAWRRRAHHRCRRPRRYAVSAFRAVSSIAASDLRTWLRSVVYQKSGRDAFR